MWWRPTSTGFRLDTQGRDGWTWYTGSAAWLYRVGLESILGLQARRGSHLVLDPRIPSHWPQFELPTYRRGSAVYRIQGHQPLKGLRRACSMSRSTVKLSMVAGFQSWPRMPVLSKNWRLASFLAILRARPAEIEGCRGARWRCGPLPIISHSLLNPTWERGSVLPRLQTSGLVVSDERKGTACTKCKQTFRPRAENFNVCGSAARVWR